MRKAFFLIMFTCCMIPAIAQKVTCKNVSDEHLVYILNNIEKHISSNNIAGDMFINVYVVADPSGSAGGEEITNTIYIATSEDGEVPEQHLFKLTSVYDPKIVTQIKTKKGLQLTFIYGAAAKREKATVFISLRNVDVK